MRVSAPPVEGAANDAIMNLLATRLDLPRRSIALISGEHGRNKRVRIEGLGAEEVRERLGIEG